MEKIDKLSDNLPKTDGKIRNAYEECMKERRVIERVNTFVNVQNSNYKAYLESALNALRAAQTLLNNQCYEWVIVPSYSAMFQAGNAVLIKELGRECKDHFCLLISLLKIKKLGIEEAEKISKIKDKLEEISDREIGFVSKLRLVRSSIIYKPSVEYKEKELAEEVFKNAQDFVNKISSILRE
jgi:uncharacterized protein (UPF0332 family)